ncbi:hypothetical protein ABGB12_34640 [Actinocorallia sp. B10E7]|uniref:hypothetical protein n=1 Tax=Actinocorallia sp. B10E7 TaxID=3153558 RepID=UPI00325C5778
MVQDAPPLKYPPPRAYVSLNLRPVFLTSTENDTPGISEADGVEARTRSAFSFSVVIAAPGSTVMLIVPVRMS